MSANVPPPERLSPAAAYIVLVILCGAGLLGIVWGGGGPEREQGQPAIESPPPPAPAPSPKPAATPAPTPSPAPTASSDAKLEMQDITVGTGETAAVGDKLSVQYVGTLVDGTEFDASMKHGGKPFEFPLGQGRVIKGWDQGMLGMKVGGKRKLTIPPELGYGARGAGDKIPPNSTLVFTVELVGVQKAP